MKIDEKYEEYNKHPWARHPARSYRKVVDCRTVGISRYLHVYVLLYYFTRSAVPDTVAGRHKRNKSISFPKMNLENSS